MCQSTCLISYHKVTNPATGLQVDNIQSDALFILLVEKDAAFMRLAEDRFYNTYPCIILTAKGQPDVASRWVRRCVGGCGYGWWVGWGRSGEGWGCWVGVGVFVREFVRE